MKESASQKLYYEIQSHLSDLKSETIGWNLFEDKMEESLKNAIELEKEQMKGFVTTFLSSPTPAVNNFVNEQFEKYYEETFLF